MPNGGLATRYRLLHPCDWEVDDAVQADWILQPAANEKEPVTSSQAYALALSIEAEIWSRAGFGEAVRYFYQRFAMTPTNESGEATTASIAYHAGVTESTARRHLNKLATAGLCRRTGRGLWSIQVRSASDLAWDLGIPEQRARRRSQIESERLEDKLRKVEHRLRRRAREQASEIVAADDHEIMDIFRVPERRFRLLEASNEQTSLMTGSTAA